MVTAGIIAEYNPFHNGHQFHIEETRRETGADFVIAVMSGNFVQRGAPALLDKFTRARMALEGGADLILELPAASVLSHAEGFAAGGVCLLERSGVIRLAQLRLRGQRGGRALSADGESAGQGAGCLPGDAGRGSAGRGKLPQSPGNVPPSPACSPLRKQKEKTSAAFSPAPTTPWGWNTRKRS